MYNCCTQYSTEQFW